MNPRVVMTTRMLSSAVVLACAVARVSSAQSRVQSSAQSTVPPAATVYPVGVWRGTSVCLVHPSACHDEVVVYRIAPTKTADSLTVDARKVVRGAEEEMGILDCRLVRQTGR